VCVKKQSGRKGGLKKPGKTRQTYWSETGWNTQPVPHFHTGNQKRHPEIKARGRINNASLGVDKGSDDEGIEKEQCRTFFLEEPNVTRRKETARP